jgi:hypothetical protein
MDLVLFDYVRLLHWDLRYGKDGIQLGLHFIRYIGEHQELGHSMDHFSYLSSEKLQNYGILPKWKYKGSTNLLFNWSSLEVEAGMP